MFPIPWSIFKGLLRESYFKNTPSKFFQGDINESNLEEKNLSSWPTTLRPGKHKPSEQNLSLLPVENLVSTVLYKKYMETLIPYKPFPKSEYSSSFVRDDGSYNFVE